MQVPAYWPVELGVQCVEYKGVFVEVKNVTAIDEESGEGEEEPMPDMEEEEAGEVEVVEAMEVMVVDIDMPDIEDMFSSLAGYRVRFNDSSVLDHGRYCLLICANNELSRLGRESSEGWKDVQRFMRLLRKSGRKSKGGCCEPTCGERGPTSHFPNQ